jgi:site-specific DNA-methyltransferase (adenine-specific)
MIDRITEQPFCQTDVSGSTDLINKIHNENCLDTMAKMPDNFIDLTVTSPPYDDQRKYNGYCFDFENVAKELFRVTKQGGVVVWNVNDKRINGSKNLTSFKQAIKFNELGFNIHDIMIWRKPNPMPFIKKDCYTPSFEFMFILSKGNPKTFNAIMEDCKYAGQILKTHTKNPESIRKKNVDKATKDKKIKSNVWDFIVAGTNYGHPAIFPEQLANDHIISWSNEKDIVYDCFAGSGTTAKMSIINNRKWIVSEISAEYCDIIKERINIDKGLFENVT